MVKWLVKIRWEDKLPFSSYQIKKLFDEICLNGYSEMALWLQIHSTKILIESYDFSHACSRNDFILAKCLIDVSQKINYNIDINANNYDAFRIACWNNNIPMAKWLIEVGKISSSNKDFFPILNFCWTKSVLGGNLDFVKWLIKLGKSLGYSIDIHQNNDRYIHHLSTYYKYEIA